MNILVDLDQAFKTLRKEYSRSELDSSSMAVNPLNQFYQWVMDAIKKKSLTANTMVLATVGNRQPYARVVLLKVIAKEGLIFYSNYESPKAKQLEKNKQVELVFYWPELERQVRIRGRAQKVSRNISKAYFESRPRDAQIGAWVSQQSSEIVSRRLLDELFEQMKRKFNNKKIPLPSHWGGYVVKPKVFEFWQGRMDRMNDRIRYIKKKNGGWQVDRLQP